MPRRRGHLAFLLLLAACGGGAATDAGVVDATVPGDTLSIDAFAIDAATPDAGRCTGDEDPRPDPNAGLVEAPGVGGCPAGMIPVADFCVDRYEASLVADDGSAWSPFYGPGSAAVRAVSIAGAVPQGYISGDQAAAACAAAGKRLCSDAEWLRACRGPDDTDFPYGPTRQPGVCNDARAVHPAVEYFESSDPVVFTMLSHPCLDQLPDSLDASGANVGCVSAEGAFDLMGNLHEWTADPAGTFRGGFFVDTAINGPGCAYVTTAHDRQYSDYSTGFRCCSTP